MALHLWALGEAKADEAALDSEPLGYAAATFCWLLAAGVWVAAKWAEAEMPPWTLCFARVAIAFSVLLPMVYGHRHTMVALLRARWIEVLSIGGLGLAICQGLIYIGLHHTSAINAGLIMALMPIMTLVLAHLLLGEALGPWHAAGALVAACGMAVIVARGDLAALLRLDIEAGELWVVAGAFAFALYTVLLRRAKFDLRRLPLLVLLLGAGTLTALPFFLAELVNGEHSNLDRAGLLALAYVGIPGGALMYLLYNWSIDVLGASKAGTFVYLQPVFVSALAWLLLGETIAPFHLAGAALILVGVVLTMAVKGKPRHAAS